MTIPVTREEIIRVGARFPSEAIVAEIDRLLPIAAEDQALLEAGGYGAELLDALRAHRATLTTETAERRAQRGQKKSARKSETDAIVEAKRVLRAGIAMAEGAIAHRVPPADEPPETTKRIAIDVMAALEATGGRIDLDSAKLRTRLAAVAAVLGSASIAPAESGRAARAAMIARVQAAITALPALAEEKKAAQRQALTDTDALDEIDGRAYLNMKTLTKVGRTQWIAEGDPKRAAVYTLQLREERAPRTKPGTDA
ncbi:hypothetical protein [Sandaracinus amylolyticus]|uniref:hypothetical protein n=1 Tax=Sandaracinus amylolyticus TaxID=927083 RepID=UPI001F2A4151|nr:hypothetical protein [Sandaracinus amylolyticus]UJR86785.1 Hypothetical protein I5071_88860 [Sandaracinus amylolyticus]